MKFTGTCDQQLFGDALAFTANPPHQQGLRQGAPIGYGLALPPTANKGAMPMPPPGANKDLPRRYVAEWLKLPALPANKDLWQGLGCASELMLRRGLFGPRLEQRP